MDTHFLIDEYLEKNKEAFNDIIKTMSEKPKVYDRDAAFLRRLMLASFKVASGKELKKKFVQVKPEIKPIPAVIQMPVKRPVLKSPERPKLPTLEAPHKLELSVKEELHNVPTTKKMPELPELGAAPKIDIPKPEMPSIPQAAMPEIPKMTGMEELEKTLNFKGDIPAPGSKKKDTHMDTFSQAPSPY